MFISRSDGRKFFYPNNLIDIQVAMKLLQSQ